MPPLPAPSLAILRHRRATLTAVLFAGREGHPATITGQGESLSGSLFLPYGATTPGAVTARARHEMARFCRVGRLPPESAKEEGRLMIVCRANLLVGCATLLLGFASG